MHLFNCTLRAITLLQCVSENIMITYPFIALVVIGMDISAFRPELPTPNKVRRLNLYPVIF